MEQEDSNPAVRTKAVLALHKLAHHGHVGAIKILHTVYANPSDNYQVNITAADLIGRAADSILRHRLIGVVCCRRVC